MCGFEGTKYGRVCRMYTRPPTRITDPLVMTRLRVFVATNHFYSSNIKINLKTATIINSTKLNCKLVHKLHGKQFDKSRYTSVHMVTAVYKKYIIYETREKLFDRDIQTPRRELKIRRAADYL